MKKFTLIFLISALILVPGCLGTEKEVVNVYVCPDGSLASNADDCPLSKEKSTETEVMETTKYVCPDGGVVDNVADCPTTTVKVTSTIATTSIIDALETTTLEELGTTIAEETTSTIEEETSSTVESASTIEDDCQFVGSVNSDVYHYPDCPSAKGINPENLICFNDEKDAQAQEYRPCGRCDPPT